MVSLALAEIETPQTPWKMPVSPAFQALQDVDPIKDALMAIAEYFESSRNVESFVQVTSLASKSNADPLRQMFEIQVSSLVSETFGVAQKRQPREFVFTYGIPQLSVLYRAESRSIDWLQDALTSAMQGDEDAALTYIAFGTTNIKTNQEELERLSDELDHLDVSMLPDIVLVSLLRNTFAFRSRVRSWSKFLGKTEQVLQDRGQPIRSLLRGLKT